MQEENPYQSPMKASFVEQPLDPQSLRVASESRRVVNFFVDDIVVRLLSVALGFVIGTDIYALPIFFFPLY